MNDWLAKLSEEAKSEEQVLHETVQSLPHDVLQGLSYDLDPSSRPTQMEAMEVKIADAVRVGQELASEHSDMVEKKAFIGPLLAGAARLAGGQALKSIAGGVVKDVAKDAVVGGVSKAVSNAVRPPAAAGGAMAPAMGGFSYGKTAGALGSALGGFAQRAAGYAVRNPGTAATLLGAAGGAIMAPRDPETGQKQYMRGALMGGGLAAGANALSRGAIGNKLRGAVMNRESPLLGQGARSYLMDAARATKGSYGKAVPGAANAGAAASSVSSAAAPAAGARPAASAAPAAPSMTPAQQAAHEAVGAGIKVPASMLHPDSNLSMGGGVHAGAGQVGEQMVKRPGLLSRLRANFASPSSVSGGGAQAAPMSAIKVASPATRILLAAMRDKLANQQTLTYDPSTKTFVRQHLNADTTMGTSGSDVIPAGHTEPVARGAAGRGQYAGQVAPAGTPAGGGMAQTHSLHGGNVMSSTPARGIAARPAAVPPPIPMAARMGGPAGLAGSAAKAKMPSLAGAVSLAKR